MKTVRHKRTLFYYEGPQVFEARDCTGGHYVAVMLPDKAPLFDHSPREGAVRYLIAGVSADRLHRFRTGRMDLRSLLLHTDQSGFHIARVKNDSSDILELEDLPTDMCPASYFPMSGFVLDDHPPEAVSGGATHGNNVSEPVTSEQSGATTPGHEDVINPAPNRDRAHSRAGPSA